MFRSRSHPAVRSRHRLRDAARRARPEEVQSAGMLKDIQGHDGLDIGLYRIARGYFYIKLETCSMG